MLKSGHLIKHNDKYLLTSSSYKRTCLTMTDICVPVLLPSSRRGNCCKFQKDYTFLKHTNARDMWTQKETQNEMSTEMLLKRNEYLTNYVRKQIRK